MTDNLSISVSQAFEGNEFNHFLLSIKNDKLLISKKRLYMLLDNSGSMSGQRLDLVIHACKTIISSSDENVEISIFTFSSNTVKITNLEKMNTINKNIFLNELSSIRANGSTKLLNGLKDILNYIKSIPNDQLIESHCLVFTDGEPDEKEQILYTNLVNSFFSDTSFNCIIDVFGFGNSLSLDILNIIYTVGKGVFCYISDINMMATIFNNYLANLFSTIFNQIEISYEFESIVNSDINFNSIVIGSLLSSQERNFIIQLPVNTKFGYFNIKYNDLTNYEKVSKIIENVPTIEIDFEKYYLNKCRFDLINILKNINTDTLNMLKILYSKMNTDISILEESISKNDVQILMNDIISSDVNKGQIEKALHNYNSWGKYYLISIYQAHINEITINFKDLSIEKYSGIYAKNILSNLDNIFNSIPFVSSQRFVSQQSYQPVNSSMNNRQIDTSSINNRQIDASSFNNRYAGCFCGKSIINIFDKDRESYNGIYLENIKSGDILFYCNDYTIFVEYILKTKYIDQVLYKYVNNDSKNYTIGTSTHPVLENDKWIYLKDSMYSKKISSNDYEVDYLYSISAIKITNNNTISNVDFFELNNLKCATFGHGVLDDDNNNILSSTFWGQKILYMFHHFRNNSLLNNNVLTLNNNYYFIRDNNGWCTGINIDGIDY
jgi:uncharacterized protein YegL